MTTTVVDLLNKLPKVTQVNPWEIRFTERKQLGK